MGRAPVFISRIVEANRPTQNRPTSIKSKIPQDLKQQPSSPSNYYDIEKAPESPQLDSATANGVELKARALFNYSANPEDPSELSFNKGDILDIIDNKGKWWHGMGLN